MREGIHRILTTLNRMFHSIRNHLSDKPIMIFDPIYIKRHFLLLLVIIGGMSVANAQFVPWVEDFDRYSIGTDTSKISTPFWETSYSGPGEFSVQNVSSNNVFLAENTENQGVWTSEWIDISGVNYAEINMNFTMSVNNGSVEAQWFGDIIRTQYRSNPDTLSCYYRVNDGSETLFYRHISNKIDEYNTISENSNKVLKGDSIQVIVKITTTKVESRSWILFFWTGWSTTNSIKDSYSIDKISVSEVTTLYSRKSGTWNAEDSWSVHDHSGEQPAAGVIPTNREGAVIGNTHQINLNRNEEVAFLEVHNTGKLNMNTRTLTSKRGGNLIVEQGGRIFQSNNAKIVFPDPFETNVIVNDVNGINIQHLEVGRNAILKFLGVGSINLAGNLSFTDSEALLDNDILLDISGNITSNNTNQLINRNSITLRGQIDSDLRLFSNYPGSVFNYARGGNQTIITPEDAYHHLSLSGSGTKSTAGNFSINGDLNITGSATLSYNNTISLAGDFNNLRNSTSTLTGNGTFIFNGSGNQTYTSPAALTFSNLGLHKTGGNLTLQHNMTSTGTATVRNTNRIESSTGIQLTFATLNFPVTNALLDLNVNTTISGNITLSAANNQLINRKELTLTGNFPTTTQVFTVTNSENSTVNWGGGTAPGSGFRLYSNSLGAVFNYNRTNAQPIILPQDAYHHLTLSGSGNKTTNGNFSINGNINITESAVLSYGHTISLAGDFINNRNNTGAVTTPTTGSRTLIFNGSGNQTYTSPVNLTFLNIGLNKTGGRLVLERQLAISGSMAFINGVVETTSTNLLIFNSGATQTGSHNNSYVEGPVRKLGNQDFTFPVGDGGIYAPIRISSMQNGAGDTHFTAQYHNQPAPFPNQKETDFSHVSGAEYWDLSRTYDQGNNARCFVQLYWMDADRSEIIQPSDLIVAHYNSQTSKWEKFDATVSSNSIVSQNRIANFSPFTFGSSSGINPLPVEFLSFTGTSQNNGNLLKWQTATEHNNDYFSVEKSKDGKEWSACGQVEGHGDSFTTLSYSYLDQQAAYGVTYYRLKQVDFNGEYDYSSIISVNNSNIPQFSTERAYPNPTNGELMVRYTTPEYGQITLTIQNLQGQPVVRKVLNAEAGSHTIEMDIADLANGLYLLVIQQNQNQLVERIVKQ